MKSVDEYDQLYAALMSRLDDEIHTGWLDKILSIEYRDGFRDARFGYKKA